MKRRNTIHGIETTAPRPTRAAAIILASALSVPIYVILTLLAWWFF